MASNSSSGCTSMFPVATELLPSPWLDRNNFTTVKRICSQDEELYSLKKSSMTKVVKELKKGRLDVEKRLTLLQEQIVQVGNWIQALESGHDAPLLANASTSSPNVVNSFPDNGQSSVNGQTTQNYPGGGDKVDNQKIDLSDDGPCTTRGLWQYMNKERYLDSLTVRDIDDILALDDGRITDNESLCFNKVPARIEASFDDVVAPLISISKHEQELISRLISTVLPSESVGSHKNLSQIAVEKSSKVTNSKRLRRKLRDIGLIEVDDDEFDRCVVARHDDEILTEIRRLSNALKDQATVNNAFKRELRLRLEKDQSWVSRTEEWRRIEKKYIKMWRKKKEAERKKKQQRKKLLRQGANEMSKYDQKNNL